MTCGSVNSCIVPIMVSTMDIMIVGRMSGTFMCHAIPHLEAPSTRAESKISVGMAVRAVVIRMTLNPPHSHITMFTMDGKTRVWLKRLMLMWNSLSGDDPGV